MNKGQEVFFLSWTPFFFLNYSLAFDYANIKEQAFAGHAIFCFLSKSYDILNSTSKFTGYVFFLFTDDTKPCFWFQFCVETCSFTRLPLMNHEWQWEHGNSWGMWSALWMDRRSYYYSTMCLYSKKCSTVLKCYSHFRQEMSFKAIQCFS